MSLNDPEPDQFSRLVPVALEVNYPVGSGSACEIPRRARADPLHQKLGDSSHKFAMLLQRDPALEGL